MTVEAIPRESTERQDCFTDSISSTNSENSRSVVQHRSPEFPSSHRNRWSEDLCRRVLVQECSDIPRNFNYADGVQFVYAKLVEWLGDENLDLSIGVLYEFIEVDCDYTHDEGAAFKRWQHDHLLRKDDLGNSYIPRMPYIVVGNPKPTERLARWRKRNPERYRKVLVDPPPHNEAIHFVPHLGIGSRNRYQLENSWFVSSKTGGTQILPSCSKTEHHKKVWDPEYGTGGTLVQTREIRPRDLIKPLECVESIELMDHFLDKTSGGKISNPLRSAIPASNLPPKASFTTLGGRVAHEASSLKEYLASSQMWSFIPERSSTGVSKQSMKCQYGTNAWFKYSGKVCENSDTEKGLPDQDTVQGRAYCSNIENVPLPNGIRIPNGVFVRKHELVPKDTQHLPEDILIGCMESAEDLAVTRGLQSLIQNDPSQASLPSTPQIFKDRGLDFKWVIKNSSSHHPLASLGDGSHSPSPIQGDVSFRQPASPSCSLQMSEDQRDSSNASRYTDNSPTVSLAAENNTYLHKEHYTVKSDAPHRYDGQIGAQDHNVLGSSYQEAHGIIVEGREHVNCTQHSENSDRCGLPTFKQRFFRGLVLKDNINLTRLRSDVFNIFLRRLRQNNNFNDEIFSTLRISSSVLVRSLNEIKKLLHKRTRSSFVKIITLGKQSHSQLEIAISSAKVQHRENCDVGPFPIPQILHSEVVQLHPRLEASHSSVNNTQVNVTMPSSTRRRPAMDLNRDLPPLPVLTPIQPLYIRKQSGHLTQPKRHADKQTEEEINDNLERLPVFAYDAVRDGSKYGGVHYFNDGRGKVFIPPTRISSKSRSPALPTSRFQPQTTAPSLVSTIARLRASRSTESIASNGEPFNAFSTREEAAGINRFPSRFPIRSSADANDSRSVDDYNCPEKDESGSKMKRSSVITLTDFYDELTADTGLAEHIRDSIYNSTEEYKCVVESNAASTNSIVNERAAKGSTRSELTPTNMSTSSLYLLESPSRGERTNDQLDLGSEECETFPTGLGVRDPTYRSEHVDRLNYRYALPTSELASDELVAMARTWNPYEFELETESETELDNLISRFNLPKPAKSASTSTDSHGNFWSYSDPSYSALDMRTEKESARLTTWTDVQKMSGSMGMLGEKHTESGIGRKGMNLQEKMKERDEGEKIALTFGTTERKGNISEHFPNDLTKKATPQLRGLGHMRNAHSESNNQFRAKQPELVQISPANWSTSGSIEENDPLYTLLAGKALTPSNSNSSRHQRTRSFSTAQSQGISAIRQLERVSEKDELDHEIVGDSPNKSRLPMKKLFGEGGLLSSSFDLSLDQSPRPKRPGLMNMIKNKFEEFGVKADISSPTRNDHRKLRMAPTFRISLKEDEQATVYCQIELLLCVTTNRFLMEQYTQGRMLAESLKRVKDFWQSKGRAQVVEFKYDQLTQRDLIIANQKNFRFHGENANNPLHINAILYTWKQDAKEMSIRTFCSPDSMIEKHIVDCYKILGMLGGQPAQFLALSEVHQYFRSKVARTRGREITEVGLLGIERVGSPNSLYPVGHTHDVAWASVPTCYGSSEVLHDL